LQDAPKFTQIGILVWKNTIWQPCLSSQRNDGSLKAKLDKTVTRLTEWRLATGFCGRLLPLEIQGSML
jgi:hypothetical protein